MNMIGKPFQARPYSDRALQKKAPLTPPTPESMETPKVVDSPQRSRTKNEPQHSEGNEVGQVKPMTLARLRHATANYGPEHLKATMEIAHTLFRFHDLDKALQLAIEVLVRTVADSRPDAVRRYCGSTLVTGYVVGRAMLGTSDGALHYSNRLTEADNVESLVRASTLGVVAYTREIGPMGQVFMEVQIEMANRAGPLSALPEEERSNMAGGSAVAGLVLAIAEYDLFAA